MINLSTFCFFAFLSAICSESQLISHSKLMSIRKLQFLLWGGHEMDWCVCVCDEVIYCDPHGQTKSSHFCFYFFYYVPLTFINRFLLNLPHSIPPQVLNFLSLSILITSFLISLNLPHFHKKVSVFKFIRPFYIFYQSSFFISLGHYIHSVSIMDISLSLSLYIYIYIYIYNSKPILPMES